jgi:hypothetical protein
MYGVSKVICAEQHIVAKKKSDKEAWRKGYERMLDQIGYTQEVEDTIADLHAAGERSLDKTTKPVANAESPVEVRAKLTMPIAAQSFADFEDMLATEGMDMLRQILREKLASRELAAPQEKDKLQV